MPQHKISPYRVKLRQDHKPGKKVRKKDLWDLGDLPSINPGFSQYDTLIDLLKDFFNHLDEEGYLNDNVKRTLTAINYPDGPGNFDTDTSARTIEAELTYGRYNRVADHTDKTAFEDVKQSPSDEREPTQRDRDTVAETRLHVLVHVPTSTNRSAFIVLHSYGRNSVKSRLKDALNQFIAQQYDSNSTPFSMQADRRKSSFKLEMNTVAGSELIDKLKDSKIVGFEVNKKDMNVPEYMSESTALSQDQEGDLTIQFTSGKIISGLKTKNQSIWERIRNEKYPLGELVDDDPSRANAIIEASGDDTRKINITKDEVRMEKVLDSTELDYDDEGRVRLDTVGEFSRGFLNQKLREIGADTLDTDSLLS